jgi:hypothetical protein
MTRRSSWFHTFVSTTAASTRTGAAARARTQTRMTSANFKPLRDLLITLKATQPANEFDGEKPETIASDAAAAAMRIKREQGLVVVHKAFTNDAFATANRTAKQAWEADVKPQIPAAEVVQHDPQWTLHEITSRGDAYWPTTVIGNKNFGYLIAGAEAPEDRHRVTLPSSGTEITFALGGAFRANLALLCHESSAAMLDFIFRVSGRPHDSIISQDYCKIFRGDLTVPHVDIYERAEESIHRMQAIAFGPAEGRVRLCYLRFSQRPEVRALIVEMIGGKNIYGTRGFQALPKDARGRQRTLAVIEAFRDAGCVQYGAPRDLVMWEPGVIHFEARVDELDPSGFLLKFANDKRTTTERYIVGTHVPIGFSQRELLEIGCIADAGFVFHSYDNANAGNAADANSVHKKTTQWKVRRAVPQVEKARAAALKTLDFDAIANTWSAAQRRCYMAEERKRANDDDDDDEEHSTKKAKKE